MAGCSRSEETVKTLTTKKSPRRSRCPAQAPEPMTTADGTVPARAFSRSANESSSRPILRSAKPKSLPASRCNQPKTHSKPDRHSKQIWESSAAPDSNAVRIIMFAEYPAEEPLAENPPKRLSAQALLPLRVKPHRALQSALDLLRSLGESRQSIVRQTGDNGGLSC